MRDRSVGNRERKVSLLWCEQVGLGVLSQSSQKGVSPRGLQRASGLGSAGTTQKLAERLEHLRMFHLMITVQYHLGSEQPDLVKMSLLIAGGWSR